jgi:hypothetical protein
VDPRCHKKSREQRDENGEGLMAEWLMGWTMEKSMAAIRTPICASILPPISHQP